MDKRFGDLDGDGKVDQNDLAILRNLVQNKALFNQLSPDEKKRLDLNNDGSLNYDDIIEMIKAIKAHVDAEGQIRPGEETQCLTSLRERLRKN